MPHPDPLPIEPIGGFDRRVRPPGSKSLTNRALLAAALAEGRSELSHVLLAEDTEVMAEALRSVGVGVELSRETEAATVEGCGGRLTGGTDHAPRQLFLGNAGTAYRFLTAACCLGEGTFALDGVERMRQRPIGELVGALRTLGGEVAPVDRPGYPPLRIRARGLAGGRLDMSTTVSSQYLSALLLAAPRMGRGLDLNLSGPITSLPYVRMTVGVLRQFGVAVDAAEDLSRVRVEPSGYQPTAYAVEPDASSASYFLAAAAILPDSACTVEGLGRDSLQGDTRVVDLLGRMGADVTTAVDRLTVASSPRPLEGVDVDLNETPDLAQTLAVVALFARGPTTLRNVGNLRVKETDRLEALRRELSRLGASATVDGDDLTVEMATPGALHPATVETYDDHRMAMSFAVAGLRVSGIRIRNPSCVDKTFPRFFDMLDALRRDG